MDVNKILSADILDIIFDGRNKDYGAYELRRTYNKRMVTALVATVAVCLLFLAGSIIANSTKKKTTSLVVQADVQLEKVQEEK